MVDRRIKAGLVDTEPCGGVSLGIEIDEEGRVTRQGKPGREIDRGRRLADAALLVNDGDCSGYIPTTAAFLLDRRPIILRRARDHSPILRPVPRGTRWDLPATFHVAHSPIPFGK